MNATPKIIYYYFNFGHYLLSELFKICYLQNLGVTANVRCNFRRQNTSVVIFEAEEISATAHACTHIVTSQVEH
jgi:hypothetical protein